MTSSALVGSTEEKLPSTLLKRAWPQPLAETWSTPSTPWTALITSGLNPGAWVLEVAMYRSALVWSDSTSPNEAFRDEANTPMLTTRVRPIIRAAAVAEVRRVFRVAFCFASSPGMPRSFSGVEISAASGRTASGSEIMTPIMAATRPSPNTFMSASA